MTLVTHGDVCLVNNSVSVNTVNIWQFNSQQFTTCGYCFSYSLFRCLGGFSRPADKAECQNTFNKKVKE